MRAALIMAGVILILLSPAQYWAATTLFSWPTSDPPYWLLALGTVAWAGYWWLIPASGAVLLLVALLVNRPGNPHSQNIDLTSVNNSRKLRIGWSVGCGLAFVLPIVLWVRRYWWFDNANFSTTRTVVLNSIKGGVAADSTAIARQAK